MRHPHLWYAHMTLRFAGWSINPICPRLGISTQGACGWDRQFLTAMRERAPELYRWWSAHQSRDDRDMPGSLARQADEFVAWIGTLAVQPGRQGTAFERLAFRSKWVPFVRLWLDGASDLDVIRALGISSNAAANWRMRYERVARERNPDLLDWASSQRARRYHEASEAARMKTASTSWLKP